MLSNVLVAAMLAVAAAAAGPVTERAAPQAQAMPVTQDDIDQFSYAAWVEDLIRDRSTALSPEQVASIHESRTVETGTNAGRLVARAPSCDTWGARAAASVLDAVKCIDTVAARGSNHCGIPAGKYGHVWCSQGTAELRGGTQNSAYVKNTCNNIARSAGKIMDACSKKAGTVQGYEYSWGDHDIVVILRNPNFVD